MRKIGFEKRQGSCRAATTFLLDFSFAVGRFTSLADSRLCNVNPSFFSDGDTTRSNYYVGGVFGLIGDGLSYFDIACKVRDEMEVKCIKCIVVFTEGDSKLFFYFRDSLIISSSVITPLDPKTLRP